MVIRLFNGLHIYSNLANTPSKSDPHGAIQRQVFMILRGAIG